MCQTNIANGTVAPQVQSAIQVPHMVIPHMPADSRVILTSTCPLLATAPAGASGDTPAAKIWEAAEPTFAQGIKP